MYPLNYKDGKQRKIIVFAQIGWFLRRCFNDRCVKLGFKCNILCLKEMTKVYINNRGLQIKTVLRSNTPVNRNALHTACIGVG